MALVLVSFDYYLCEFGFIIQVIIESLAANSILPTNLSHTIVMLNIVSNVNQRQVGYFVPITDSLFDQIRLLVYISPTSIISNRHILTARHYTHY